jgi:hypothetical protein
MFTGQRSMICPIQSKTRLAARHLWPVSCIAGRGRWRGFHRQDKGAEGADALFVNREFHPQRALFYGGGFSVGRLC